MGKNKKKHKQKTKAQKAKGVSPKPAHLLKMSRFHLHAEEARAWAIAAMKSLFALVGFYTTEEYMSRPFKESEARSLIFVLQSLAKRKNSKYIGMLPTSSLIICYMAITRSYSNSIKLLQAQRDYEMIGVKFENGKITRE